MKKFVVLLMVFSGCVSATYLTDEVAYTIPLGANAIKVESSLTPDSLFNQMALYLIGDGNRITENKERLTISTEGKQLMEDTMGRYLILIQKSDAGSIAIIRSEWSVTESVATSASVFGTVMSGIPISARPGWEMASWSKGRPNISFSYGLRMARSFGTASCYVSE